MTIIDRKVPIRDPRDDQRESGQSPQAVQDDVAAADSATASAPLESPLQEAENAAAVPSRYSAGRRSPSSSQRSQSAAQTAALDEEERYIFAHDTVAAASASASTLSEDAGPVGALPPSYGSIVRRDEDARERRERRRSRRRRNSSSTHSYSDDEEVVDEEQRGTEGGEEEEPTERTWLFSFSRPEQRWRDRRRGGTRRPQDGSKGDARRRAKALFLHLVRIVLLCFILAMIVSEFISLVFPDRRIAPPAPYALPAHMHGKVVEVIDLGSPRDAKDAGDRRVPPGSVFVRKEVVLDGQNLQVHKEDLLSLLRHNNSSRSHVHAFLFHTTGIKFAGAIDIAQAHSPWPEYQASLNKTQASINITAFSHSHSALESALTLARVATRDGKQGLTLASDQQPWYDPAQSGVTVLVDIGLPILTGEIDDWSSEVVKPILVDLDVSTETMDIAIHDSNTAKDDQPDDKINRYRNVNLFSAVGWIRTGVVFVAGNLSVQTLQAPITGIGIHRASHGAVNIRSGSGSVNLGVVTSPRADFHLKSGKLNVQLLQARNMTIETDSAGVEGMLLPYGTVVINTNTGSVDCRVSLAALRDLQRGADVRVISNLGSIMLRYQQQASHTPLRSYVQSRVGTVDVTLSDSFQGDWLVTSQVEGIEEISTRPGKEVKVDRGEMKDRFSLQGRVWLRGQDEHGRGRPGWGYCETGTYIAPIRLTL